ncbi:hypothetical protein CHGG_06933 [Chaetomium globosum CBS 148.51]|uniref:non-specific serine/threonine protein kinase n=1 Tax=Chaetomium globosum (strain ATCC 6205 / CBS 148.51 / DSM 1962 / NBRC 6347 / NRRL 1970) TaxID=306901 RepID=Q2GYM1_CHAGB|nr:uncharacterized protein CHGG_06933 [Chaetomium globosum CBS 148.51]EAQ85680.1 hypothetical protein CHGG_06933 [Chaetomium globosum CBS 148.51]
MYEPANGYRPGGFHPVLIGDVLNGHFKVANKLGFSTKATVGLCRDLASGEWRAIKIYAAESSHENLASAKAQATLHLTASLEHFWVVGPNGRHLCAVQRLVGPSIALAPYHYGERPLFLGDLCRQMATAVSSFHKQGLYHGRLHPDNIRFVVDDTIHELTEEKMNRVIDYPYTSEGSADLINKDANLSLSANVPKYLVSPAALDFSGSRLSDSDDDDYRGPYVTPFIALADLDACTQHPPNNNTTTTTPTTPAPPFKPTLHPSSYTPPETWATTLSPNPLLTTSTDTHPTTPSPPPSPPPPNIWALAVGMYATVCATEVVRRRRRARDFLRDGLLGQGARARRLRGGGAVGRCRRGRLRSRW